MKRLVAFLVLSLCASPFALADGLIPKVPGPAPKMKLLKTPVTCYPNFTDQTYKDLGWVPLLVSSQNGITVIVFLTDSDAKVLFKTVDTNEACVLNIPQVKAIGLPSKEGAPPSSN